MATDAELNEYVGLKKIAPYRKKGGWEVGRGEKLKTFKDNTRGRTWGEKGNGYGNGNRSERGNERSEGGEKKKRKGKKEREKEKAAITTGGEGAAADEGDADTPKAKKRRKE